MIYLQFYCPEYDILQYSPADLITPNSWANFDKAVIT